MKWPSLTSVVIVLFMAYICHSAWTIYQLFNPKSCPPNGNCIKPYIARNPTLELSVFTSTKEKLSTRNAKLVWKCSNFSLLEPTESTVTVKLPKQTRNNGSLYVHVFLHHKGEDPYSHPKTSYAHSRLTTYALPKATAFNLLNAVSNNTEEDPKPVNKDQIVSHWRSKMTVNVLSDMISFPRTEIPGELYRFMRFTNTEYLPLLYIDELSYRIVDRQQINESSTEMPLTISYAPISVGKLRFWVSIQQSMEMLHQLGFGEKDTDEMKGIFADTNFYFLMLTFVVAAFHLLFDFLAFKNDINFWKERDSMVGLSTRVVLWRSISTAIIFLYLLDQDTSLLVLIPSGIGAIIEFWKVKKAFKVAVEWQGWRPSIQFGGRSEREKETVEFDAQAMKYLSYVMYPLCVGGAIYSLFYTPHKSWYSWCIRSLVNGIYAFGFLFMMPQLFVNYKLKSVAHLPWRAFMYKAFNTFIDDIFAFIITMPTAHRLACFRDDVIFVIYLYQRWLYPVDKTRVNEYGQSFDETAEKEKKQQ